MLISIVDELQVNTEINRKQRKRGVLLYQLKILHIKADKGSEVAESFASNISSVFEFQFHRGWHLGLILSGDWLKKSQLSTWIDVNDFPLLPKRLVCLFFLSEFETNITISKNWELSFKLFLVYVVCEMPLITYYNPTVNKLKCLAINFRRI